MGVTIHYRGTMDNIGQVELMEDRILDLVFSLGGRASIWRSFAAHDSTRAVRGLLVDLEPGHETSSLLISPEGHLTPLFQIDDAENAPFNEPPYCFVKTQFGSPQGHVAIVHLLDALRQRFFSNLVVSDDGEYYEKRDVTELTRKMRLVNSAIPSIAEGLKAHGLNAEAAEDPSILATRIERIARLVQKKLLEEQQEPPGEADHLPAAGWSEPSLEEEVEAMDRLQRQSDLRSERMTRRIAEATASGLSAEEAFELAMESEGLAGPPGDSDEVSESATDEPWVESLPSHSFDEATEDAFRHDHPAVVQSQGFLALVMSLARDDSTSSSFLSILMRASMDMVGGLVQATCQETCDNVDRALTITQLKRALSGHASARGAIFGLRSESRITDDQSKQFHEQLESLLDTIHELMEVAWT